MKNVRDIVNVASNIVERLLEVLIVLLVVMLVLVVLWGVVSRFAVNFGMTPSLWTEEFARLSLIWVTFIGAAVGFARHEHLGLDYFANLLDPAARLALACVGEVVVILFAAIALVYGGLVLVQETLAAGQLTAALQVKMGYVYLAAPIAGVCIILFSLRRLLALASDRRQTAAAHDPHVSAALD